MRKNGRYSNELRSIHIEHSLFNEELKSCRVTLGYTQLQVNVYSNSALEIEFFGKNNSKYTEFKQVIFNYLDGLNCNVLIECHLLYDDGGVERALVAALNYLLPKYVDNYEKLIALKMGSSRQDIIIDLDRLEEDDLDNNLLLVENSKGDIVGIITKGIIDRLLFMDMIKIGEGLMEMDINEVTQGAKDSKTIVIATKNKGKVKEFKKLFEADGYQVKTLLDFEDVPDIVENGSTFTENAKIKASIISDYLQLPVLGDDSGLCVDALKGMPGIFSARYAGDHDDSANNAKLLSELAFVDELDRTAHFHTSLVFCAPNKEDLVVEGEVEGLIAQIPRGENGFGYDPLFYLPELDKTMAELTVDQKNQLSHRAVAISNLKKVWKEWLED